MEKTRRNMLCMVCSDDGVLVSMFTQPSEEDTVADDRVIWCPIVATALYAPLRHSNEQGELV